MGNGTCGVSACTRDEFCRGWCRSHYARWWKRGDVQQDKPLPGDVPAGSGWCSICRETKPIADFYPALDRPSGRSSYCRPCMAQLRHTKYRAALRAHHKRWAAANPTRTAEYLRTYRSKPGNREKATLSRAAWAAANPDRSLRIARAGDAARRAREKGAPGSATVEQIQARWDYYGGKCWMCGNLAEATDHVKPLAKGGSHWPANLRPACHPCNAAKRARWPYPLEVARGRPAIDGEGAGGRTA